MPWQHEEFCSKPQLNSLSSKISQNPGTHFNLPCLFREHAHQHPSLGGGGGGGNLIISSRCWAGAERALLKPTDCVFMPVLKTFRGTGRPREARHSPSESGRGLTGGTITSLG